MGLYSGAYVPELSIQPGDSIQQCGGWTSEAGGGVQALGTAFGHSALFLSQPSIKNICKFCIRTEF